MAEIDKKIINILINNKKELNDFAVVGGEYIFSSQYRRFVKNLLLYTKSYNSPPTLDTFLLFVGKNKILKENISNLWVDIEEAKTDKREFSFLLEKIKKRYNKEIIQNVKDRISDDFDIDETNNLLIKATNEITNLDERKIYKEIILKNSVEDWLSNFRMKAENKELAKGVMTGFKTIDYYLNGLKPGELFIYGADSGAGKSIFLINLATNCFLGENILPNSKEEAINNKWKKTKNVLFVSIEMGATEIQNRILSCMCDVNSLDLDKAIINSEDAEKLKKALLYWEYSDANLKIIDAARGVKTSTIQEFYDNCCLEFKPDLIIVDYLGIMASDSNDKADWERLKDVAESLHEFARINNVPVVSAVQLKVKKPGEGEISLSAIGRSSMIAHNCNFVCIAEGREDEHNRIDLKLHFIKNRRGPLFSFSAKKCFQFSKIIDEGYALKEDKTSLTNEDLTEAMSLLLEK